MKQKSGKAPRPRFHVVFLGNHINDSNAYSQALNNLQKRYPYFDSNAFDAGRFFFGNPDSEVIYHPGSKTLLQYLDDFEAFDSSIPEGKRNSTMHKKAVKFLKRYGETEDAKKLFLEEAGKCNPALDNSELKSIWSSAVKFYRKEIVTKSDYVSPDEYNAPEKIDWEIPVPFDDFKLPPFPVDAYPESIRNYVTALAESTQTPVDMAASSVIPVLSVCAQGKFKVRAKADWDEPLNTYLLNVMEPSERKSAVENAMIRPINNYEIDYNNRAASLIESSRMQKHILERRQKALEEQAAKGKDVKAELNDIAVEIAGFHEEKPLKLYVDDITTEKLASVLSDNNGRAAILSTEGGIFDTLAGIYSKNVNIDVMLKGYSGDCIRVDRIGRGCESIMDPALTILLMAQPSVLSGLMNNNTFRGRGLTARFLYCVPASGIGKRKYRSEPVPDNVYVNYEMTVKNMLKDKYPDKPETISLSPEADKLIEAFADELESKLNNEYQDIKDWAGKLIGNTHRIAGLLCRASVYRVHDFDDNPFTYSSESENKFEPLVISGDIMANAIRIAKYYIEHAKAAFSLMGADNIVRQSKYVLNAINNTGFTEFKCRDIMRVCRRFKKAEDVQHVLDHLSDYGYIAPKNTDDHYGKGRPPAQVYLVNPYIYEQGLVL